MLAPDGFPILLTRKTCHPLRHEDILHLLASKVKGFYAFWAFSFYFRLKKQKSRHIIPKHIDNIFFFDPADGIQHCNENHQKHTGDANTNAAPRENKIKLQPA